jgi:hypothetical protein
MIIQNGATTALHKTMKIFLSIVVAFLLLIILGAKLPDIIPGCSCGFPASPCHGCGELIGNTLGNFAWLCIGLGLMGLVLLMWWGIPIAIICLVVYGIYKVFSKAS